MEPSPYLEHGEESLLGGSGFSGVLKGILNVGSDILGSFLDLLDSGLDFVLAISEDLLKMFKSGGGVSLGLNSFSLVSVSSGIEIVISIHEVFIIFSIEFVIFSIKFIIFGIEFIIFGIEFIININKVFVISSNNLGSSVGGRLDGLNGLHRSGRVSLVDGMNSRSGRVSLADGMNSRSGVNSSVDRSEDSGSNSTVSRLSEGLEDRADRSNGTSAVGGSHGGVLSSNLGSSEEIIVFGIEFVIFGIEFVIFSIEFVIFSEEFIVFSIEFIIFGIEFIIFGIEFIININPVFVGVEFNKVFVISSNNLASSVGGRLDGESSRLKRGNRSSSAVGRSGMRSGDSGSVGGSGVRSRDSGSVGGSGVRSGDSGHVRRSGFGDSSHVGRSGLTSMGLLDGLNGSNGLGSFGSVSLLSKVEVIFSIEEVVIFEKGIIIVFIHEVLIVVFDKVFIVVVEEGGLNLGLSGLGVSGVDRSGSGDLSSGVMMALLSFSH